MFEVGKAYRISYTIDGDVWQSTLKVIEVDLPLIKVENAAGEVRILNTHSPTFHSAEPFSGRFGEPFEINVNLT